MRRAQVCYDSVVAMAGDAGRRRAQANASSSSKSLTSISRAGERKPGSRNTRRVVHVLRASWKKSTSRGSRRDGYGGAMICRVFDASAAHECRLQDSEAYAFFDFSGSKETRDEEERGKKIAEDSLEGKTSTAKGGAPTILKSIFVRQTEGGSSYKYLPHGGLGLCMVISYAYFTTSRKVREKEIEKKQRELLGQKKTWLKSRILLSMSSPEEQQENMASTEFPDKLAEEEKAKELNVYPSEGRKLKKGDYNTFLKDSKADRVLAPSESTWTDETQNE